MSGEMSGHLFRLTGLETDIICADTRIVTSYKGAGSVQRLGLRGDVDETTSGSKLSGNYFRSFCHYFSVLKHRSFAQLCEVLACTQSQMLKAVEGQLCE